MTPIQANDISQNPKLTEMSNCHSKNIDLIATLWPTTIDRETPPPDPITYFPSFIRRHWCKQHVLSAYNQGFGVIMIATFPKFFSYGAGWEPTGNWSTIFIVPLPLFLISLLLNYFLFSPLEHSSMSLIPFLTKQEVEMSLLFCLWRMNVLSKMKNEKNRCTSFAHVIVHFILIIMIRTVSIVLGEINQSRIMCPPHFAVF